MWSASTARGDGIAHMRRQHMLTGRKFAARITRGGRKQINLSRSFRSHKPQIIKCIVPVLLRTVTDFVLPINDLWPEMCCIVGM